VFRVLRHGREGAWRFHFCVGRKTGIQFHSFACSCSVFHLLKRLPFPPRILLAPLSWANWPNMHAFISWLSVLSHWSVSVLWQYCTVLITIALKYTLNQEVSLQFCSSFSRLLWLFGVFCGPIHVSGFFFFFISVKKVIGVLVTLLRYDSHTIKFTHLKCTIWWLFGKGNGNPLQYSCLENPTGGGAWWAAVLGVAGSRTRLSDFTFTFHFHALEKEMATHSSVLAWRVPGMGEPGGLPSVGSHRVGHDWSDSAAAADSQGGSRSPQAVLRHLHYRQEKACSPQWISPVILSPLALGNY